MQVKCEIKSFLISVWLTTNVIHVLSCKRMLERESWLAYVDCSLLSDEKIMGVKVVILARFKRLKPVRFNVDFQQTNFLIEQIVLFNEFCLHSTSSLGLLSLFWHDKQKKRWGKVFSHFEWRHVTSAMVADLFKVIFKFLSAERLSLICICLMFW